MTNTTLTIAGIVLVAEKAAPEYTFAAFTRDMRAELDLARHFLARGDSRNALVCLQYVCSRIFSRFSDNGPAKLSEAEEHVAGLIIDIHAKLTLAALRLRDGR